MQNFQPSSADSTRTYVWIAIITMASVACSLSFACATPFAAFAAAAALSLPRKQALFLVGSAWLANQLVGYGLLGYPQNANSFMWGAVIGGAALLATFACHKANGAFANLSKPVLTVVVFVTGVLVYQAAMLLALFTPLGNIADFNVPMIKLVVGVDIVAFLGLLVVNELGRNVGLLPATQTIAK